MIKFNNIFLFSFLILLVTATACKKDFKNPNAAQEEDVFTSARGLTAAAIGLQKKYASSRAGSIYNIVAANGFVTNELVILNTGNLPEAQLNTGGTVVDGTNTILANIWSNANKIIFDADRIINAAPVYADAAYASGLIGYATIFKAMSLGSLAMYWEKTPDTTGSNVTFSDRKQGFLKSIAAIDKALAIIGTTPVSTNFTGSIVAGTDIVNTLRALKARYALFAGEYALALQAANAVDLTKASTMNFDAVNINPIYETATATNNVFQPVGASLGLPSALAPAANDGRISFYTSMNTVIAPLYRVAGFGAATTTPWPYYLPGEMMLIKAEAYARQTAPDINNAIAEINKVRTKTVASDPLRIGANLPAYAGGATVDEVLTEIYRQRCIELFMSGLKLEDMRRFNRPPAERKRNFFPYPFIEKDNNTNTPADPAG